MSLSTGTMSRIAKTTTPIAPGETPVSIADIIVKTFANFVLVVLGAVAGWRLMGPWANWQYVDNGVGSVNPMGFYIVIGSIILAVVLGFVNAFKKKPVPLLILAYSLFEGVLLGAISVWYQAYGSNNGTSDVVQQAVLGTLVAFAVTLTLYATGIVRVGPKFRRVFIISIVSYLLIGLASFISAIFGVGGGWGFYGVGPLGIVLCIFGVALASVSLIMNFDYVAKIVQSNAPQREAWRCAFGLIAALVWLYLEMLRLFAIMSR